MIKFTLAAEEVAALLESFEMDFALAAEEVLLRVAMAAYTRLQELAQIRLESTRAQYLADLRAPKIVQGGRAARISLEGFGAQIELGFGPYDIRDTILEQGETSRVIRMRQKWPEASFGRGADYGTPAGKQLRGKVDPAEATRAGRALLRELRGREANKQVRTRSGRVRKHTGGVTQKQLDAAGIEGALAKYYRGMRREVLRRKAGQETAPVQYAIYRTVSRNSDPSMWRHPGYEGAHLFKELDADLARMLQQGAAEIFGEEP